MKLAWIVEAERPGNYPVRYPFFAAASVAEVDTLNEI